MGTKRLKFLRSALGVALLAGSAGVVGGLGIGAANGGQAFAVGQAVSGTYSCATALGEQQIPISVQDLNTVPATLANDSTYAAKPQVVATIPSSLISIAHEATPTLTELPVTAATLTLSKHNFSGPAFLAATHKATLTTDVAIVPIDATTLADGYTATVTYTARTFTVTATSGKATLTPTALKLVSLIPLTCFPPSKTITPVTGTTPTAGYTVNGLNTLGAIDSATATAGVPIPPTLTSVTPASGPAGGGTAVTLTGSNFLSGATTVTFGGTTIPAGSVTFVSSTEIRVSSPAHAAGPVTVTATTLGGTSGSGEQFTYQSPGAPSISAVTPPTGTTAGGTPVTIHGANFVKATTAVGVTAVKFGTAAATFTVISATTIVATAPAHAAGTATISVTTPQGTTPPTSADLFKYTPPSPVVSSISPTNGPPSGGTRVTVTGSDFSTVTSVAFGTRSGTTVVVDGGGTQLTVVSPSGTSGSSVAVRVVTPAGESSTVTADLFTYGPTITSIAPTNGPVDGGNAVTITGTEFTSAARVKFATSTATTYSVTSPTRIVATAPPRTRTRQDLGDDAERNDAGNGCRPVHLLLPGADGYRRRAGRQPARRRPGGDGERQRFRRGHCGRLRHNHGDDDNLGQCRRHTAHREEPGRHLGVFG